MQKSERGLEYGSAGRVGGHSQELLQRHGATAGVVFVPLASMYQKRTGSWFKFGEIIQGISMNCDV